jgi:dynamin 1-like protein
MERLTKRDVKGIRENLPRIIKAINDRVKQAEEELQGLGQPMPTDDAGKMSLLWNMINEYCDIFRNILQGKYNNKRLTFLEGEGGFKIKILYKKLLEEFTGDYKATNGYSDEDINYALTIHEGDSIPGFPSVDAFIYLLRPQLEKLREPIEECFNNVFQYLDFLSGKILEKTFIRFPQAINDLTDLVTNYLLEEREKTKYLVDSIVDMEINYLFTNDPEYLNNFTTFIPKHQRQQMNQNNNQPNNNQMNNEIKPQPPIDGKTLFIKEIRNRIEAYFKLIVRNLRDSIPKIMGNFLVKEIEDNMQLKLYNKLYNAREMTDLLSEPESIAERRKELNELIKVMRNAQKIIRRDPDLMSVMEININDSDITGTQNQKAEKRQSKLDLSQTKTLQHTNEPPKLAVNKNNSTKKPTYGNLFG